MSFVLRCSRTAVQAQAGGASLDLGLSGAALDLGLSDAQPGIRALG